MPPPRHCPACTATAGTGRCTRAAVPPTRPPCCLPVPRPPKGRQGQVGSEPPVTVPTCCLAQHTGTGQPTQGRQAQRPRSHRTATQDRSGMGRHSTHSATHPHPHVDVPTSPSAGKTGRVGSANHNGNHGRCRNARHAADSGNRLAPATQHHVVDRDGISSKARPARCTTSTSTMATTTGACHLDNPPPGQCASHRPATTNGERSATNGQQPSPTRSTASGQTGGVPPQRYL